MAYARIPAVKSYLALLIRLRGVWGWSLLASALTPALVLLSILISSLLGRQPITSHRFPATGLMLIGLIAVKFLYQFFFFNATGEEAGWRGFALPRMQSLTSPLVACLVINIFWPLWHLFLWMAEGRPVFSPEYWAQTYLELLPGTVTLGWIYNRSKGSILVAGITHAAANTAYAFFPNLDWTVFNWTVAVAALVMILVDRMWKKLPPDHPAVCQVPALDG
jgi:membrane protease YdiL (CAAX protease family)